MKDDPDLSPDDKKVLLGIHKRQVLAAQPSPTDLKFLDDCYKSSTSKLYYSYGNCGRSCLLCITCMYKRVTVNSRISAVRNGRTVSLSDAKVENSKCITGN